MSRTRRRQDMYHSVRHPRGAVQAMRAVDDEVPARKSAIPPTAWDDARTGNEATMIWNAVRRLVDSGLCEAQIRQKLKKRFSSAEINFAIKEFKRRIFSL